MLPVFPVYPYSLCISKSTHSGALPSPAYPYVESHRSAEIHTVVWIPGPWVQKSQSVFGDSNVMILDGHNTGMGIPHLSPIMDNLMLPVTLVSSSCSWPFASSKAKSQGKGWVGFFPAYAPYLFCDAPEDDKADSDSEDIALAKQGKVKLSGRSEPIQIGTPTKRPGLGDKMKELSEKTGFKISIPGRGRVYIPTCKTVMMRMSLTELLYGWAKVLISAAFDALAGAALKPLVITKDRRPRLDPETARRLALNELSKAQKRELAKTAAKQLAEHLAVEAVVKAGAEGVLKSMVFDGQLQAPYGLFSYSFAEEKGTFLWWGKLDGSPCPIEFKGVRGEAIEALAGAVYQPQVEQILADNPNYATAAGGTAG